MVFFQVFAFCRHDDHKKGKTQKKVEGRRGLIPHLLLLFHLFRDEEEKKKGLEGKRERRVPTSNFSVWKEKGGEGEAEGL